MISIFLCPVFVNVCCPCCCSKEIGSLGHAGEEICWCSVSFISLHPLGSGAVSVGWNFAQSGSGPGLGVTLRSCCYNVTTDDPALNRQGYLYQGATSNFYFGCSIVSGCDKTRSPARWLLFSSLQAVSAPSNFNSLRQGLDLQTFAPQVQLFQTGIIGAHMCPVARARPRGLDLRYPGIIIWIHNRASNEGSRRFHNHGKVPIQGLLLVDHLVQCLNNVKM